MNKQERWVDVQGGRLRVCVQGPEGAPALVFSNSLGTTLEMWDAQAARFAQDFRVVRYDTRGHGASVVTPGPYQAVEKSPADARVGRYDLKPSVNDPDEDDERQSRFPGGDVQLHQP